jgi:four helix bundle protein
MTLNSYHDLIVWQRAVDYGVDTYRLTGQFPRTELYGLTAQLQRAVVSIPSNIAEGAGRIHTREFIHHASIARGSLFESETQIIVAQRLGYVSEEGVQPLLRAVAELGRLLHGLIVSLERKLTPDANPPG